MCKLTLCKSVNFQKRLKGKKNQRKMGFLSKFKWRIHARGCFATDLNSSCTEQTSEWKCKRYSAPYSPGHPGAGPHHLTPGIYFIHRWTPADQHNPLSQKDPNYTNSTRFQRAKGRNSQCRRPVLGYFYATQPQDLMCFSSPNLACSPGKKTSASNNSTPTI